MNDYSKILGEKPIDISTIYEDYENDFYISVPYNYKKPNNFPHGYMKVYFGDKFCRLSFFEPEYIYAENGNYIMTKEQINLLMEVLNKPYKFDSTINNFQAAIYDMNFGNNEDKAESDEWQDIPNNLPIPDYTKLKCISTVNGKWDHRTEIYKYEFYCKEDDEVNQGWAISFEGAKFKLKNVENILADYGIYIFKYNLFPLDPDINPVPMDQLNKDTINDIASMYALKTTYKLNKNLQVINYRYTFNNNQKLKDLKKFISDNI